MSSAIGGRASGVLLHPTSLPGPHGSGDFGPAAFHFIDWLVAAGQRTWQILPLGPTGPGRSPYMSPAAFAIDPLLIDLAALTTVGWLPADALDTQNAGLDRDPHRIDDERVIPFRMALLRRAAATARDVFRSQPHAAFVRFCEAERAWLDDYARFMAIATRYPAAESLQGWQAWPPTLVQRDAPALERFASEAADELHFWRFVQWVAATQWVAIKRYANERGVRIIGDVPIFVAPHGADIWAHPELFELDEAGRPRVVAGVPPDYFSATGQRWGNPLYRWAAHRADGFAWWIGRLRAQLAQADIVRIDHFRGFEAYWEIPADAATAVAGRWCPGPGAALFDAIGAALGTVPVIAEDLGTITPEVTALRERFGLPGMRVLQFAFDGDPRNPYLPHNFSRDAVVYTGTHDNDTTRGWFDTLDDRAREAVCTYLGTDGSDISWRVIHAASASVANLAIYPFQDVLNLGTEARMNRPGVPDGCWTWRFDWSQVPPTAAERLRVITLAHGRADR